MIDLLLEPIANLNIPFLGHRSIFPKEKTLVIIINFEEGKHFTYINGGFLQAKSVTGVNVYFA